MAVRPSGSGPTSPSVRPAELRHERRRAGVPPSFDGSITAPNLLIGDSAPISLASVTLSFDTSAPFDRPLSVPSWDLGPFLHAGSSNLELQLTHDREELVLRIPHAVRGAA